MRVAMVQHDRIVYGSVERNGGALVESGREGDSVLAVFVRPRDAAAGAVEIQRAFRSVDWPGGLRLRTRIALHTGEVELREGHYFGPPLNRCARVLALAHGGQVLVTQATRELLADDAPSDVELTDLGVHRLKDLRRSERVFQLSDLTQPERFPPVQSRGAYRTNLPEQLTNFVGRERELVELRELLARARLVTLTGPGGVGKTRLAKQIALEAAADTPGGAWFLDLAPLADPKLVERTVATALDLEEQQGRTLLETLADHCAEGSMLLVFDNCEHLLAASADLAASLLASCRELRIVATSREPLGIGGEVTWRVPSLAPEHAAQLFVDRARDRSPRFAPSAQTASVIDEICERLDGIPLAIELAAARTAIMSPGEVLRRLGTGLALAGADRTAADRQKTLEAAIAWSYELLSPAERTLLERLAVFAGSFSVVAAERVCHGDDLPLDSVLEHLSQLVMKSLVQSVDDRYTLLHTVRAYAHEKLVGANAAAEMERRRAGHVLELASSRRPGALGDWLDAVETDYHDIRAALAWCIEEDPGMGAEIAAVLYDFWLGRGYVIEARAYLRDIVARLPTGSVGMDRALLSAGVFAYTAGDFAQAAALIEEGMAGARASGDRELIGRGLVFQGAVALATGHADAAQSALDEALGIAREIGRGQLEAAALHHLGSLASVRGEPQVARDLLSRSLELRRRLGTEDEASATLMLHSAVGIIVGDLSQARADVVAALRIGLALRDRRAAWSLDVLACLEALDGNADRAVRLGAAAQAVYESTAQSPPAVWQSFVGPLMARARSQLGEAAASAAMQFGRDLTFDQALHYALGTARSDPLGPVELPRLSR
ncbi:MAG: AAA family ATPase [Candidatus Limnocylindria bacterium]